MAFTLDAVLLPESTNLQIGEQSITLVPFGRNIFTGTDNYYLAGAGPASVRSRINQLLSVI
jgi:hypothetical protein